MVLINNRLRVLHILPNFGPGGAERMAVNLMCGLVQDGFDVAAVSLYDRQGTDLELMLEERGIPVWYLGKRRGFDPRMYIRLERVLRRLQPDVIHTHLYVLRYLWPLSAYRHATARIHTVHNIAEKEVDAAGRCLHYVAFRTGVVPVAIAHILWVVWAILRHTWRYFRTVGIYGEVNMLSFLWTLLSLVTSVGAGGGFLALRLQEWYWAIVGISLNACRPLARSNSKEVN